MPSRQMKNFNALKAKGLSDDEALKQSFGLVTKGRAYLRAADKAKRKTPSLRRRAKMAITKKTTGHSPAGQRYLRRKKAGV